MRDPLRLPREELVGLDADDLGAMPAKHGEEHSKKRPERRGLRGRRVGGGKLHPIDEVLTNFGA
jgi:hypothetical protein